MHIAIPMPRWAASPWQMLMGRRVQIPEDGEARRNVPGPKQLRKATKYSKPKRKKGVPICVNCYHDIKGTVYWLEQSGRSPHTNEWRTIRQAYCRHCAVTMTLKNPRLKFTVEIRK